MPNHVANELTIEGEDPQLNHFRRFSKAETIRWKGSHNEPYMNDFEASRFIHPEPHNDGGTLDMDYNTHGYDWCIKHWGNKWGAYDVHVMDQDVHGEGIISYQFNTAWSPFSMEFCLQMSKLFPQIRFDYRFFEEGMGYMGQHLMYQGMVKNIIDKEFRFKEEVETHFQYEPVVTSG